MDLATLLRKVKREFGDEYGIIINDNDIFDWANDAQLKILRETTSADTTIIRAANTFPFISTDKVIFKRVAINNRALQFATLAELDLAEVSTTTEGTPIYWYQTDSDSVGLWPAPKSTDTFDVVVTYAKIPTPLSLVAPYLQWKFNTPATQYATIGPDTDYNTNDLTCYFEISIDSPTTDARILYKGNNTAAAGNFAYLLTYRGSTANGRFTFDVSNGTTIRTVNLDVPVFTANERRTFKLTYTASNAVVNIYSVSSTGVETLLDTEDTGADPFNISSTTGYSISFGASSVGSDYTNQAWKLHYFKLLAGGVILTEFDGEVDLVRLPTIPASPFTMTSGQTMTVNGGLQVYSPDNAFSVPEVWHEDIVRFCLARAHQKNRNTRAMETAMEEFQQNTSQRRYEAQSADGPSYRGVDPFDYGLDWVD